MSNSLLSHSARAVVFSLPKEKAAREHVRALRLAFQRFHFFFYLPPSPFL